MGFLYVVEIAYTNILPENTDKYDFGPGQIIFDKVIMPSNLIKKNNLKKNHIFNRNYGCLRAWRYELCLICYVKILFCILV